MRFRHLELDEFVIIPDHIHGIIIICANRSRGGTAGDVDIMRLNPLAVPLLPPLPPCPHSLYNNHMIELNIPGRGELRLQHLVSDVNGTLAVDGELI
ncbi:MAG: hypothetical protein MUP03_10130, partial [Anaerolineales bacterium]|nr:hypothetical protein [Anaerolineales bacterium]